MKSLNSIVAAVRAGALLAALLVNSEVQAQALTTTNLVSSSNPSILNAAVTLTATVSPSTATGKVTFYDGATVLGARTLSSGQATLITKLLPFGNRSLKAYYGGEGTLAASLSATVVQTVASLPQNGFLPAVNYSVETPFSVAVGDFNGDGKADLAVGNYLGHTVSLLLSIGDGNFQMAVKYNVGDSPYSVASGDFNGDGKADLAVANLGDGNVSALLGNGDGTFQSAVNYAVGNLPYSIAVGDFNRDGKADLVVANEFDNDVSVLLGEGDGSFHAAITYNSGARPYSVAVGDFNGDGKSDLAVANLGDDNISVLLGNGDGTFQSAVNYAVGSLPFSIAVCDFNADGKMDLAVANNGSTTVSVLLGIGDGTFQPAVHYNAGTAPISVAVGDINGDGRADLAVANRDSNNLSVLLGNGVGTFQAPINYNAGTRPIFAAVGDFNGDGRSDLTVANGGVNNLSILLGTPVYQGIKLFLSSVQAAVSSSLYRYDVPFSGTPTLEATLTDPSFDNPFGLAFNTAGELFVVNRSAQFGNNGSVSRFLRPATTFTPNGVISGGLANSHFAAFRNGELFVSSSSNNSIQRFVFDAGGNAAANGSITAGLLSSAIRGLVVAPWGELFVSQCCGVSRINRYVFDSSGVATPNGTITGNGLSNPHGMAFSPRGELFIANPDANTVSRFTFDASHSESANGQIGGNGMNVPVALAFSPWGELFVSSALVSRFIFDSSFNAISNGTISAPNTLGDVAFAPETVAPDLAISKTHSGSFTQGQTGATYSITVANTGLLPTSGTVTVDDALPAGLTATAISGSGWTCTLSPLRCTRSDALPAGGNYPSLTLTVNAAPNAALSVANLATVSGGAELNIANDTASDATSVLPLSGNYNGGTDFSLAANPNGPWSYGVTPTLGGAFTLLTSPYVSFGLQTWSNCCSGPYITYNPTGTPVAIATIVFPPGMLVLDPSYSALDTVLRWTAPGAGTYFISGSFQGADIAPTTTDTHILKNSTQHLFDANINTYNQPTNFAVTIAAGVGDTIDFVVGIGNGDYVSDSTGLLLTITNVTATSPDAPVISALTASPPGLSQSVAPYYGGSFTLTVNGQNFQTGAIVSIGSPGVAANVAGSTQLSAQVAAASLSALGTVAVKVTNPDGLESNIANLKVVVHGDVNSSGSINIGDALVLALTVGGSLKPPLRSTVGDLNLNASANIGDALALALFAGRLNPDWSVPLVTSTSPAVAVRSGTLILNGSGFAPTPADNRVLFMTASGAVRVIPDLGDTGSLTVSVPSDATGGTLQVYRLDVPLGGREFSLPVTGTTTPLMLTAVTPYAAVQPGASVVLSGNGFDPLAENNVVVFKAASGSIAATVSAATATSLTVTVPNSAVCGPVTVTVSGQTSKARVVSVAGTTCAIQLVDIWGAGLPGETIVLEGAGFDVTSPANNVVQFAASGGGRIDAPALAVGGTQLHVRIPPTAIEGNVTVTVGNATSPGFFYRPPTP